MTNQRGRSLRNLLIYPLALLCAFSALTTGMFLSYRFYSTMKEEILSNSYTLSKAITSEIENTFKYHEYFMEQIANRLYFEMSTQNAINYDSLKLAIKQIPSINLLTVLDTNLRVRSTIPFKREEQGLDYSGYSFVRESLTKKVAWSDVSLCKYTGQPAIHIAISFEYGVVVGCIDGFIIQDIVKSKIDQPHLHVIVTDKYGNIVTHPDPIFVDQRVNILSEPIISKVIKEENFTGEFQLQNQSYLGVGKKLPFNGWAVIVGHLKSESFKGVKNSMIFAVAFIGLFALLGGTLSWLWSRRIYAPIKMVENIAQSIKDGNFNIEQYFSPYSEIQDVYDAIHSMAKAIREREIEVKKSEMKYRDLIENAMDPIILLDIDGNILEVNKAFLQRGYEIEEVISKHITEFIAPEHRHLFWAGRPSILANKGIEFEVKSIDKQGHAKWYIVSARPLYDDMGNIKGAQCIAKDINELKNSQKALRESEERYRSLYNSISDLIYTQDLEGRILSCNPALSRLFGYEPEEFVGRKVSDFMKPEYRDAFEKEYLAKLKEKKELEGVTVYFTKEGRKVYVEWKSKLVEPEVGPPFITGIARDVTEKFLAQRRLKESESQLKAIFETVPVPVAVYDSDGYLVHLNTAFTKVFGWTLEEAKGQKLPPLPEEEIEEVRLKRDEAVKKGSIEKITGHRFTKDGRLLDVEIYASALTDKEGKLNLLVVAFHDVTERNRLEKALQHAEKMEAIGTLAGGIAHNFNNILMGIQGNAQLLKMRIGKDHPEVKRIDTILTLVNDASNLTKQMLGLAKGGKYELKPTNLNDLIREHDRIFSQTRKDVEIREELDHNLWPIMCDRGQVKQVLMNLYLNAVQAMEAKTSQTGQSFERKTIVIKTENVFLKEGQLGEYQQAEGDFVMISISDNGIGMDEEIKKRIFEPFFTTKAMGRGTGLGLASVYGIVKNHGGYIEVESKLGEGSTFYIYLPRISQVVDAKEEEKKKEKQIQIGTGTILLVDDEELVLQTAKELLEELGYKVIGVTDPLEALKVHEDYGDKLDLIIVDMIMPKMNGLELIKAIRAKDENIKIMVSSGYGLEADMIRAKDLNIAGTIQKPFSIHSISDAINAVI